MDGPITPSSPTTYPVRSVVAIENYVVATSQIAQTTNPWGVKVSVVEVKDVELAESMRRAMARQAEAERERRAKVIHAHGEFEAAEVFEVHPAAMQLRVLSTMADITNERTSTLIFPLPMELLRLVDTLRPNGTAPERSPEAGSAPSKAAS